MIAHVSDEGLQREQTVEEHTYGVYRLSEYKANGMGFSNIAKLCAIYHDIGKEKQQFQNYIKANDDCKKKLKGKIEHSSSGAKYIYELYHAEHAEIEMKVLAELASYAVAAHHGVFDNINSEGKTYWKERLNKAQDYQEVCRNAEKDILKHYDRNQIENKAKKEMEIFLKKFVELSQDNRKEFRFYLACFQRMILSVLIDSDWEDTAYFMMNMPVEKRSLTCKEIFEKANDNCISYIEKMKYKFKICEKSESENNIYKVRNEIQKQCLTFAKNNAGIYCLSVPTGGGKTLSSLVYAIAYAKEHPETQRIFYVAPYISIIEQNVNVIKEAVGNIDWVLEHHSNVVVREDRKQEDITKLWLDINWEEPFVCTTFVQFMNALFSDKKQAIRRMNKLANSVIIIDEVQAIPIQCIYTLNCMLNFLNNICKANIVLCTATQPQLANPRLEYKLHYSNSMNIIGDYENKFRQFDRVDVLIMDENKSVSLDRLAEHVMKEIAKFYSILIVLNTKSAVKKLYEIIQTLSIKNIKLYYLTTNLCAEHRSQVINDIKMICQEKKHKCIVVSTNLIEAGVDISFECVYRSIAGLDSISQTAGRCNRNGELKRGILYLVNLEGENKGKMKNLLSAIDATNRVLHSKNIEENILFPTSIEKFYNFYYFPQEQREKMKFPVKKYDTNIFDLLTNGYCVQDEDNYDHFNNAAYKTVGREYQLIEKNNVGIIVPYKEGNDIIFDLQKAENYQDIKKLIKCSQRYTVDIPNYKLTQYLEKGIVYPCSNVLKGIYAASLGRYDSKVGFTDEIQDLFF